MPTARKMKNSMHTPEQQIPNLSRLTAFVEGGRSDCTDLTTDELTYLIGAGYRTASGGSTSLLAAEGGLTTDWLGSTDSMMLSLTFPLSIEINNE